MPENIESTLKYTVFVMPNLIVNHKLLMEMCANNWIEH